MTSASSRPAEWAQPHPALRAAVGSLGAEARRWLAALPARIEETVAAWGLSVDGPLDAQGETSRVLAVTTRDGTDAVLKLLVPHEGAAGEGIALEAWAGNGAVQPLCRSDDGLVLLLERCRPGTTLWSRDREERFGVISSLLPRLWTAELGTDTDRLPRLGDTAVRWERGADRRLSAAGHGPEEVADARRWCRELCRTEPDPVLLHGDLHPGNVLDAGAVGWVAIDPKPWIGDPAFDLVQFLWNELDDPPPGHPPDELVSWVVALAEAVEVDPWRVLRWTVVKAIGWPGPPARTDLLIRAARRYERTDR